MARWSLVYFCSFGLSTSLVRPQRLTAGWVRVRKAHNLRRHPKASQIDPNSIENGISSICGPQNPKSSKSNASLTRPPRHVDHAALFFRFRCRAKARKKVISNLVANPSHTGWGSDPHNTIHMGFWIRLEVPKYSLTIATIR